MHFSTIGLIVGVLAGLGYLFIGAVIGQISLIIWKKSAHRKHDEYRLTRSTATWIFFPITHWRGTVFGNKHNPSAILADGISDESYIMLMAFCWPLKVSWSLLICVACGLYKVICTGIYFILLYTIVKPSQYLKGLLVTKTNKEAPELPAKIRVAEEKPADKREALKRELGDTQFQIKKLQDKSEALIEEIQKLDQEQAAEQGADVYRADNSSESKWRPSSSN